MEAQGSRQGITMATVCKTVDVYLSLHPGCTLKEALKKTNITEKKYNHSKKILERHRRTGKYGSSPADKQHRCNICGVLCSDGDSLNIHSRYCDGTNRHKNAPAIRSRPIVVMDVCFDQPGNIAAGNTFGQI